MDNEKIMAALRRTQTAMRDNVSNLNRGGCGVFAAKVGKQLQAHGVEPEVIVRSAMHLLDVDEVRQNVKNPFDPFDWQENGLWLDHAGLRFKLDEQWWTFDSDALLQSHDTFSYPPMRASAGSLTVAEMDAFAKCPSHELWNEEFDRRQIPKIHRLVKQAFEGVDHG